MVCQTRKTLSNDTSFDPSNNLVKSVFSPCTKEETKFNKAENPTQGHKAIK